MRRRSKGDYTHKQRSFDDVVITPDIQLFLEQSLDEAGLEYTSYMVQQLLAYIRLMIRWNRAYKLTSVRDPKQIITRHIMDSLSILPSLKGKHVLDVGSGAGLPGIPLAILDPDRSYVLVDSNHKKCYFLNQTIFDLRLSNAFAYNVRIEFFSPGYLFDNIVCRAFSSISDITRLSGKLCSEDGQFLIMKGVYPSSEMADIPEKYKIVETKRLQVPFLEAERTLVRMEPQ